MNNFESSTMVPQLTVSPSDLVQPSDPYDFGPVYLGRFSEETRDIFQADLDSPYSIEPARESRLHTPSTSASLSKKHHYSDASRPESSTSRRSRIPCLVGGCKTTFVNTKNRDRHMKSIQHGIQDPQVLWHCTICKPSKKLTRKDGYRRHGLSVHLVKKWQEWLDEYCRKIQAIKHRDVTKERDELEREREEKLLREGRSSI
ncbi:hypothetical protein BDZ89DRAFT_1070351 [Hymenopellis radicata]|nr:hypothetical protein BDZ89DRAFT_1070351 [Hymenopellis radicata]